MGKVALFAVAAVLAFGGSTRADAAWMTFGSLHARERAALERVAKRERGMTEGCHVYGRQQLEERCQIDVFVRLARPLYGYTTQTFAASWIGGYGVFWTAVGPLRLRLFSDSP